jgi:hypothetical protein
MIVDGKGGAEVWYRESRQDRSPRVSRQGRLRRSPMSHGRASWRVVSASSV